MLTPAEAAEIYHLRVLLETDLLDVIVPELSDDVLRRLQEVVASLEASDDPDVRLDRRRAFYDTLYDQADRPRTVAIVNKLRDRVGLFVPPARKRGSRRSRCVRRHPAKARCGAGEALDGSSPRAAVAAAAGVHRAQVRAALTHGRLPARATWPARC